MPLESPWWKAAALLCYRSGVPQNSGVFACSWSGHSAISTKCEKMLVSRSVQGCTVLRRFERQAERLSASRTSSVRMIIAALTCVLSTKLLIWEGIGWETTYLSIELCSIPFSRVRAGLPSETEVQLRFLLHPDKTA